MSNDFIYKEEYKYLTHICLNVTDACNLACRYCFVEQHPHFMTLETAIAAVKWTYNNFQKKRALNILKPEEKCSITFFGGEPTLMYNEIIVPLINFTNSMYPDLFDFSMTTNGTLLTENKLKFLKENNVSLLLSIDGDKETQDYNRPCQSGDSSFDKINIPLILKYYPNITFRSTIYADTVENLFNNYLFAEQMGFKSTFFTPDIRHDNWSSEKLNMLGQQLNKIFAYRLKQTLNDKPVSNSSSFDRGIKFIQALNQEKKEKNNMVVNRCGLGITLGAIGYDGAIYGCQEQVSGYGEKNIFLIGNIFTDGIDIKKHEILLKKYYDNYDQVKCKDKDKCKICPLKQICNTSIFCPSTIFDLGNDFTNIPYTICYFYQNILLNNILLNSILMGYQQEKERGEINNVL